MAKAKLGHGCTPKKRKAISKWTVKRKADFLALLVVGWTVADAAAKVKMSRQAAYDLRERDEAFRAAWAAAYEASTELLEQEAFQRAIGREEAVMSKDGSLHYVKKYSDLLLIFLLKARKPKMYRDQIDVNVKEERRIIIDLLQVVRDESSGKLMLADDNVPLLTSGEG